MSVNLPNQEPNADNSSTVMDPSQLVSRILRTVWLRRQYVIWAVIIAAILGVIKYQTSEHIYEGNAAILITQVGDYADASTMAGGNSMLPTYAKLFTSARVLKNAARSLRELSPELYVDFRNQPVTDWPDVLRKKLQVRTDRLTNFVELSYRSLSKDAAEAVLNSVLTAYMEIIEKHHRDVSVELLERLSADRRAVENQLKTQQTQLINLKDSVRFVGVQQGSQTVHASVMRMNRIHEDLMEVRQSRINNEATLKAVQDTVRTGGDVHQHLLAIEPTLGRQLLTGAMGLSVQDNETLAQLDRMLVDDRAKLQSLGTHLGPRNHLIIDLANKIAATEQYVANYRTNPRRQASGPNGAELNHFVLAMVEQRLAKDLAQETTLEAEFRVAEELAVKMNGTLTKLNFSEQELERLNDLHKTLSNQIAQVDLQQGHADVRVAVVTDPNAIGPVEPRAKTLGALCLFGGVFVGVVGAFIVDLLDDRFRSPDEIKHQLGVPVLAMVRHLAPQTDSGLESLHVHSNPEAVECEAFRTLRTTLAFGGEDLSRIGVTSTSPGDGKTTVLANLAVSYAQAGRRTLLIDADLRRPGLSNLFDLRKEVGLSDVLCGSDPIDQMATAAGRNVGLDNLVILPCGHKPPNPVELLSSKRMAELMAWAQKHFDQVLIDCPPVLAGSDAVLVGRLTDGLIVVIHPTKNHRRAVIRTVESVHAMNVPVLGVVANRIDAGEQNYGYGYGGYGGYGYGYGYGYGSDDEVDEEDRVPRKPVLADTSPELDEAYDTESDLSTVKIDSPSKSRPAPVRRRAA